MKVRFAFLSLLAIASFGCSGGSSDPANSTPEPGNKVTGTEKPTGSVEVVAFQGGYGIDMYQAAAKEFESKNEGVKVSVTGNPRVWEQLRPRMVGGTPPDLMFPGWGMDHWALVEEGQIMTLDTALDGPGPDGGKWRDAFDPNILKLGQKDGKTYILPYYLMVYGWWYDPTFFKTNGWTVPKTYEELLALAPKMKAKGVAPITFQGQYPYYMIEGMLLPWAASIGGKKAIDDAQNLVPGAWASDAMLQAATRIDDLNRKGFFQDGAVGMSHTESQMQFLRHKAGMIPCGTWLSSEMKDVMPKDAKLEFFPVPEAGTAAPNMVIVGIEPWMVPSDAKNPAGAIALFKEMTSKANATKFLEEKGTLMAVKADESKAPEVLQAPAKAVHEAKAIWSNQYRQWYPAFEKEIEGAITAMLNKEISPKQFVERCEAVADKTRKDDSVKKYKAE